MYSKWFKNDDEVPFMMKVYQIKDDKRKEIPAVNHVDGSGDCKLFIKKQIKSTMTLSMNFIN